MSDLGEIERRVAAIFEEHLSVAVPSVETDLFESGGLDSLVFVELLMLLEREFEVKVELEDMDLDNFRSIRRIAEFLGKRKAWAGNADNSGKMEEQNVISAVKAAR